MSTKKTVKLDMATAAPEASMLGGAVAFSVFQNFIFTKRD
jgi:hypothetical protein